MNNITLMGRLVADPELSVTAGGKKLCRFAVAVDRPHSKETVDFFDLVAWENTGEFVAKHFKKGQRAAVTGYAAIRKWTDKDGGKRKDFEIVASHVYFAGQGPDFVLKPAEPQKKEPQNDEEEYIPTDEDWANCNITDEELFRL